SIKRGRSFELDQFQAGTCSLTLNNRGRDFDPEYQAIYPLRPLRVSFTPLSTTYRLFTGYGPGWPQAYGNPSEATVQVQASDGFRLLSLATLTDQYFLLDAPALGLLDHNRLGEIYARETADVRVGRLLDLAGWTRGRSIDASQI